RSLPAHPRRCRLPQHAVRVPAPDPADEGRPAHPDPRLPALDGPLPTPKPRDGTAEVEQPGRPALDRVQPPGAAAGSSRPHPRRPTGPDTDPPARLGPVPRIGAEPRARRR